MNTLPKSYNYDWKALIEEQQVSGINMKKFCREKNLPYQSFKNHKRTLQAPNPGSALFLPVKQEATKNVEFSINGNLISFDASLDDEYVSRILKALTS